MQRRVQPASALQEDVPQRVVEERRTRRCAWRARWAPCPGPFWASSWGRVDPRGDAADADARRGPCQVLAPHRGPREVAEGQLLVDERDGIAMDDRLGLRHRIQPTEFNHDGDWISMEDHSADSDPHSMTAVFQWMIGEDLSLDHNRTRIRCRLDFDHDGGYWTADSDPNPIMMTTVLLARDCDG